MRLFVSSVLFVIAALAAPSDLRSAERVALVIGNNKYEHLRPLRNAVNDAWLIHRTLTDMGFDAGTKPLIDLDLLDFNRALRDFARRAQGAETAVLYYAGHGMEIAGRNYLIPTGAEMADDAAAEFEAIDLEKLLGSLGRVQKFGLVLLDACRNEPFDVPGRAQFRGNISPTFRGVRRPPRLNHIAVSFAAQLGALAADGIGRNSPYAEALARHLPSRGLEFDDMLARVGQDVERATNNQQSPHLDARSALYSGIMLLPGAARKPDGPASRPPISGTVLTVKSDGSGDHGTIAAAVKAAKPGTRIEIYPGRYRGGVTVSKPLEIVGIGARSTILWEAEDDHVIRWTAQTGLIANLTLRQAGSKPDTAYYTVYFSNGSASLRGSDLSSQSSAVVGVRGAEARPLITGNVIGDGKQSGIFVYESGKGRIEGNEIHGNALAGIEIKTGGDPLLRDNVIRDGKGSGIFVSGSGKGRIEDNEIHGNAFAGIQISAGGDPLISGNVIRDGKAGGIYVRDSGKGRVEKNEIHGNALVGIQITAGGDPLIRENVIRDGESAGILVADSGKGRIEDNEIHGNAFAGIQISAGGDPLISGNVIRDGKQSGILVVDGGKGRIETNEIRGNTFTGITITAGGDSLVRDNVIKGNGFEAVWIYKDGRGRIIDNDLRGNTRGAFSIASDAGPVERRGNKE